MERLTEWRDGHGSLVRGDGYTRLAEYEDTGVEPEKIKELVAFKERLSHVQAIEYQLSVYGYDWGSYVALFDDRTRTEKEVLEYIHNTGSPVAEFDPFIINIRTAQAVNVLGIKLGDGEKERTAKWRQ